MTGIFIIATDAHRRRVIERINAVPLGYRVEIKEPKRSTVANNRMWSMLSDLADQALWHGLKLSPEDWKDLVSAGLKRELRSVPNLQGNGFVLLGRSTSKMSTREFTALMDLIEVIGTQLGVTFQVNEVRFDEHGEAA